MSAVLPLFLSHYALAVFAILPNTFILKLLLLPFIVWQAWRCAVGLDFSMWLAQLLGRPNTDRLNFWNFGFVVRSLLFNTSPDGHFLKLNRCQCSS